MNPAHRAIVVLNGVAKGYPTPRGWRSVLRDIHLELYPGDFAVVTGPSGSGKTTLLNLAGLMDSATEGRVLFQGQECRSLRDRADTRGARIGFVFQRFHLLPARTVLANVLFRLRYLREPVPQAVSLADQLLERFGLSALRETPARNLSAGEMQRVALARALLVPPDLLIADEPTGNLDAESAGIVIEALQQERVRGACVLLATHNPAHLPEATRRLECSNAQVREL